MRLVRRKEDLDKVLELFQVHQSLNVIPGQIIVITFR